MMIYFCKYFTGNCSCLVCGLFYTVSDVHIQMLSNFCTPAFCLRLTVSDNAKIKLAKHSLGKNMAGYAFMSDECLA